MFNNIKNDNEVVRTKPRLSNTGICLILLASIFIGILICYVISEKKSAEEESYFEYTQEDVQMLGDLMYAGMKEMYGLCGDDDRQDDAMSTEERMIFSVIENRIEGADIEKVKHAYMLVGSTLLHRLESRRWGETMYECITAPGQYSYPVQEAVITGNIDTPEIVYEWAEELLQNGPEGPEGLIYASIFEMGNDTYWEIDGRIYFGVSDIITQKVKGGKVN